MVAARSGPAGAKKKKTTQKKTTSKKTPAKKSAAKKAPAKKPAGKKAVAKKVPARKAPAKKAPAKKTPVKKPGARKTKAVAKVASKKAAPAKPVHAEPELPRREVGAPGFGVSPEYLAALPEYEKGMVLLHQREFSRAEAQFNSLIAAFPSVRDLVDRARIYITLCRKQQEEVHPVDGFDDLYHQGVYLGNRGDYDEALLHLNKALALEPNSSKVHYSVASVLCLQGEHDGALHSLRRALELDPSTRIYLKNDPDFQSLHADPEFGDLVAAGEGQPAG